MSVPTLDEMLAIGEQQAREWLIDTRKELPTTWLLFFDDARPNEIIVSPWDSPFTRKLALAVVRGRIGDPHVIAYMAFTEAWISTREPGEVTADGDPLDGVMPRDDPKRREVVVCYASTLNERLQRSWEIVRDYKGTIRMLRHEPDLDFRCSMDDPHLDGAIPSMFRDAGRL